MQEPSPAPASLPWLTETGWQKISCNPAFSPTFHLPYTLSGQKIIILFTFYLQQQLEASLPNQPQSTRCCTNLHQVYQLHSKLTTMYLQMNNACQLQDELVSQLGPADALSAGTAWHGNSLGTARWLGCHEMLPHTSQSTWRGGRKANKADAAWKLVASSLWSGNRTNSYTKKSQTKFP